MQQNLTVDILKLRRSTREVGTNITGRSSPQQGVANGMDQYIPIGISDTSLFPGNFNAANYQFMIWSQAMDIETEAYA